MIKRRLRRLGIAAMAAVMLVTGGSVLSTVEAQAKTKRGGSRQEETFPFKDYIVDYSSEWAHESDFHEFDFFVYVKKSDLNKAKIKTYFMDAETGEVYDDEGRTYSARSIRSVETDCGSVVAGRMRYKDGYLIVIRDNELICRYNMRHPAIFVVEYNGQKLKISDDENCKLIVE